MGPALLPPRTVSTADPGFHLRDAQATVISVIAALAIPVWFRAGVHSGRSGSSTAQMDRPHQLKIYAGCAAKSAPDCRCSEAVPAS